jgi:hypothetical protein
MNALETLLAAQAKLNADGITEEVTVFLRKFFAGLAYTEDASDHTFTLHAKSGGYYFRVDLTPVGARTTWDVSLNNQWEEVNAECIMRFKDNDADDICNQIQTEFETMASKCFTINPELAK